MRSSTCHAAFALVGFLLLPACSLQSQQVAAPATVEDKAVIAHLLEGAVLDQQEAGRVFHQLGFDRAQTLLFDALTNSQRANSTEHDWAVMHRAVDGLIELMCEKQEFLKAGIFAGLQESYYRRNDQDYPAALAAARQALALQERSGSLETLYVPWKSIGEDLLQLGRMDEAATAFAESRRLLPDRTSALAGDMWGEIIALESSSGNSALAHQETDAFLHAAIPATPPAFRGLAQLAAANLAMGDARYDDAISYVHEALADIKGVPDQTLVAYGSINTLLAISLKAIETLPYAEALSLCERLEKDFPGLPVSVPDVARSAAKYRRRLSGQFDLVLRDDTAQLERARAGRDLPGELSMLLATALDYAYLRESEQRVACLKQAAELLRLPAANGISPLLRFRILNALGAAQLANDDLRDARAAYTESLRGMEAITSAESRQQLGDLYAEAKLGEAAVIERDGDLPAARDLLQHSLAPPPGSLGSFDRATVLLQLASLERSAGERSGDALRLYLEAIALIHQRQDSKAEIYARLQLVQYLVTRAQPGPGDDALAKEHLARARTLSSSIRLRDSSTLR